MYKKFKHLIINSALLSIFLITPYANASEISEYILEPMPSWFTERFTEGQLDINKMMKDGYTRLESVEIQKQMKDILDNDPFYAKLEEIGKTYNMVKNKDSYILKALKTAIQNVKAKKIFKSGFTYQILKQDEFYVVFDLDETLLVQWYKAGLKGDKYYDFKASDVATDNIIRPKLTSPTYVSLTPGLEKAIKDISKIKGCKGIIFFSAKLDNATYEVVNNIMFDGKPIRSFLKGLFTRNYLVREQEPTKLSKDLRFIDESLQHVIIIDDNPTRILDKQKKNLREFPKYNPDEYLQAKNETHNKTITNYFEKLLPIVVDEIRETAEYSQKNKMSFIDAYYPYSMDGEAEVLMLMKQGYSMKEAGEMLRKTPDIFDPKFFFYQEKK